jgi:hypothetical protein
MWVPFPSLRACSFPLEATLSQSGVAEVVLHCAHPTFSLEGGLDGLPLRVSNEGLLRPRVARAQEAV